MYRIFLVFCSLLLVVGLSVPALAASHYANDDAYVNSNSPDVAYPALGLWLTESDPEYRCFVEFTLGSAAVVSANLSMYHIPQWWWTANQTVDLSVEQYNFDQATLTWNNQPDASSWTFLGTWAIPQSDQGAWFSQDITSFYNNHLGQTITIRLKETWKEYPKDQYGAGFEDKEETCHAYGYCEAGNVPRIDYVVPEPGSLATLMLGLVGIYLGRRKR